MSGEEKKLTDEEVVQIAYECVNSSNCIGCKLYALNGDCKILVHQDDIFNTILNQQAKIERLTEEKAFYKEKSSTLSEDYESLKKDMDRLEFRLSDERVKNAELQKQVDELKAKTSAWKREYLRKLEECQQAVKDATQDIYQQLCGHGTTYVKKYIKEKYGLKE